MPIAAYNKRHLGLEKEEFEVIGILASLALNTICPFRSISVPAAGFKYKVHHTQERVYSRMRYNTKKGDVVTKPGRLIAKIRYYDEESEKYGPFTEIFTDERTCNDLQLQFGGKLLFHPSYITEKICHSVTDSVKQCAVRQYYFGPSKYPEPRVHVLLHSDAGEINASRPTEGEEGMVQFNPGYQYHGVKLKAEPLSFGTPIEELAYDLAKKYSLPDNKWNIGVDVVVYRDGKDRMGWHADDTQGEQIILCVVVESDIVRPLQVRPKFKIGKKRPLHAGTF